MHFNQSTAQFLTFCNGVSILMKNNFITVVRKTRVSGCYLTLFILVGYGETTEPYHGDRSKFVLSIIQSKLLSGSHPVLISPSMSGEYSVKFVGEHADLLSGYIPIAPVATSSVPQEVLQNVKVRVCTYWLLCYWALSQGCMKC
jgi:hypothetical protein